jgi:DNA-binding NarL/FixJ family response regulator
MPGRSPTDAICELRRRFPDCRTVVYSGTCDDGTMKRAYDAGAWGFLDKLTAPGDVVKAIRRVASGESEFPRRFAGQ